MPHELEVIPSRIESPQINVQAPDLTSLGQAAAAIGKVAQGVAQDINLQLQKEAGEKAALEGRAGKLPLGFGEGQRAFNKAVTDTEARMLANEASHMMQEEFTKASDPETFNGKTPQQFREIGRAHV